jgi:hypothetical protein
LSCFCFISKSEKIDGWFAAPFLLWSSTTIPIRRPSSAPRPSRRLCEEGAAEQDSEHQLLQEGGRGLPSADIKDGAPQGGFELDLAKLQSEGRMAQVDDGQLEAACG